MFLDNQVCSLAKAAADGFVDGWVGHGLVHVLLAAVVAVVCGGRVARVDGEELAFNVWAEIVDVVYAFDLGLLDAGKGLCLDAPLVELFNLDVHARVRLLVWHDAVDGAVGEAGSLFNVCLCAIVELLGDETFQGVRGHDCVFAGDDNGWLVLFPAIEALGDDWGDEFEDLGPNSTGDDVSGADLVNDLTLAVL